MTPLCVSDMMKMRVLTVDCDMLASVALFQSNFAVIGLLCAYYGQMESVSIHVVFRSRFGGPDGVEVSIRATQLNFLHWVAEAYLQLRVQVQYLPYLPT
jgi:hypothetical protein